MLQLSISFIALVICIVALYLNAKAKNKFMVVAMIFCVIINSLAVGLNIVSLLLK